MPKGDRTRTKGQSSENPDKTVSADDVTESFKRRGIDTLRKFEDYTRDFKTEFSGTFDKDGNLIQAFTSNNSHSTAIPPITPDVQTLAHNHPWNPSDEPDRRIGGAFSGADIKVMTITGVPEIRASAGGRRENVYIMEKTANSNPDGMRNFAETIFEAEASKKFSEARKKLDDLRKQGYTQAQIDRIGQRIAYGSIEGIWKDGAEKNGYRYTVVKRQHWTPYYQRKNEQRL